MRTISLLLFLLLCQSAIGFSQTVIQMKKEGGVSVIPCKVNGLKLSFVFDTGAADVSISMTEALFMLKNDYLSKDDILGTNKYGDATGTISEGIVINLKEIDIAGIKLQNVAATIIKNSDAPLLLGQSAISKLGNVQLDLAANTLTITSKKSTDAVTSVAPTNSQKRTPVIKKTTLQPKPLISESHSVIGNTFQISGMKIAQYDFPDSMTWTEAKKACFSLGDGWRLPTRRELNEMYIRKDEIGGFKDANYWTRKELTDEAAYIQDFSNGNQNYSETVVRQFVRAVRGNSNPLVISKPVKLGRLLIAQLDFEEPMTFNDAKRACAQLGNGWRLPTKEELNNIYKYKEEIGGFMVEIREYYWSTCDDDNISSHAGIQHMKDGWQGRDPKENKNIVRAVRVYK